ncbi:MAG: hypothetical protein H8E46_08805 [FCB group bacterium]|nr:hypothetical protein [FCB group bacterium]
MNRSLLITVFPNEVMIGLPISDLPQDSINIDSDGLIRVSINVVYPISFLSILEDENNLLGEHIRNMLTDSAKALYRDYLVSLPPADSLKTLIADDFNRIIKGENIYNELAFNTIELSQTSMNLVEYNMAGNNLIRLNRMLIEETFPHELRRRPQISPEIFQSVNPFFILIFTPLIVGFWNILRKKSMEPSTAAKLGIGMLLTAGCYSIMALAGFIGGNYIQVNVSWLISAYAVITLGELCLSPMGLSLVSKLAPWKIRSMMMGGWFAATAIGNKLSGLLGRYWDDMLHSSFFILLVVTSLFAALLLFLFLKFLNPVIREAEEEAKTAAN